MTTVDVRKLLHQQIDELPDEIVLQIADFALFLMVKQNIQPIYLDWNEETWQNFVLEQFFRDEGNDDNELSYSLEDAEEVYSS